MPTLALIVCLGTLSRCTKPTGAVYFKTLTASETGLHFSNTLTPTPSFNLFSYMYYYNGAGVGAADFNQDGLTDLFFASNQNGLSLFLNDGNLKFREVTSQCGLQNDGAWNTGVSVVDINADGLADVYICRVGNYKTLKGKNQLWVCTGIDKDGIPQFKERASEAGLDFSGFSTQAAFFDCDGDEDLDMFLLNHSVNHDGNYAPRSLFTGTYDSLAGHRLYINNGASGSASNLPTFSDGTRQAGINSSKIGYGLGLAVSDINLDGRPDIYVGNDFHENDYLYLNQGNGRFIDSAMHQLPHSSQFSMGVDVADLNNDAWPEIVSMDMLPSDPYMLRRSLSEDDYNIFQHKLRYGYTYQYARNNLQVNLGDGRFADVAPMAGVHATDWSWSALLFDFDNDGVRDFFATNGIPKRMNDIDYISFVSGGEMQKKLRNNAVNEKDLALINKFPEIKLPNQFFKNEGSFRFTNISEQISHNLPTFSNGALYADLDNDGDLDAVVNNINDEVLLYANTASNQFPNHKTLALKLSGNKVNPMAIGAQILVYQENNVQRYERQPCKGFLSSALTPILITGLQKRTDSIIAIWPDGSYQHVQAENTSAELKWNPGLPKFNFGSLAERQRKNELVFADITAESNLRVRHTENSFNEFDREALLPRMLSTEGPALAVADINADGLDDFFMGGSKGFAGKVLLQQADGSFKTTSQPALAADSMYEHVDAVWTDCTNDGIPDLLIATGGNEYFGSDEHLQPLLYLNDGKGKLTRALNAFPGIYTTQSAIKLIDLNKDGVKDVLLTGRALPWQYGITPKSFLLLNSGAASFKDVTTQYCPTLYTAGMVTGAAIADMNGDGSEDFVLCYNWGGIDAFTRTNNSYNKQPITKLTGWWQSIFITDIDGDGDNDLLAGNLGTNTRLHATEEEPLRMYVSDFDNNGRTEQVITYYVQGKEIPYNSKLQLEKQMPGLKKKYLYAEDYAKATLNEMFGGGVLEKAIQYSATTLSHYAFLNEGSLPFHAVELPAQTQWSEVRSIAQLAKHKWLLAGNFTANHVETGRQDAGYGTVLSYVENARQFSAHSVSGRLLHGEVRRMQQTDVKGKPTLVIAKNNDTLKLVRPAALHP